jgi:hypothetical protein
MKKILLTSAVFAGLFTGLFATTFSVSSVNGGAATGSNKLNFDDLTLGNTTQWADANVQVSFSGAGNVVQGASSGVYAAPFVSGSNGIGFLAPDQPTGVDTTHYLSTGIGSATLQFSSNQDYFGLLWGSVDNYNTLSFYDDNTLVGSFTGTQIWASANGDQGQQGTFYVNFNSLDGSFNKVVASSTQNAFELDNVAYNSKSVPDSGATLALMGVAFTGLISLRRKLS